MTQALARVTYAPTQIDTERLGTILVKSGFFKDTTDEAKAIVKVLYGNELGFGPIASMMGVYIVDGRPSLSAQLIAAAVQKSGLYRYRVREWTDKACRIEFFERNESLGYASFTTEEATAAKLSGKLVWQQYPKAMLWARAMSQGARAYTPSIFNGAIYTPEELGAEVDGEGYVVDIGTGEVQVQGPAHEPIKDQSPDEDRDIVRNADESIWQNWLKVLAKAQGLGIKAPELVLPLDRRDLNEVGKQMLTEIKRREREAAAVGAK